MGSLNGGVKGIEASLGGLVWVRRRNGRWWPGRILRPEELPDPPQSGTAIKLLGRMDESVDWYDVEKSTLVKAFRCGEYDECIEKAEVVGANASKQIGKRPSKEVAILHALEIERACLGEDHPSSNSKMTNQDHEVGAANSSEKIVKHSSKEVAILHAFEIERACLGEDHLSSNSKMTNQDHEAEDSPRSLCHHETNNMDEDSTNSKNESGSAQELLLPSVSSEDPAYTGAYKEQSMEQTSNNSEDDGTGGYKHMKGLNNLSTPVTTSSKRKRFQVPHVREFLKRKHRRRTVTKILESNIMVTVPVLYEILAHPTKSFPQGASNLDISRLSSDVPELIFSLKDIDQSSDDGLYDVPLVTEDQHCADLHPLVYSTSEGAYACGGTSNESSQVVTLPLAESGSISSNTAEVNYISRGGVDNGISKWQLKGKRSRHTNKTRRVDLWKFTDVCDDFDDYVAGAECGTDHSNVSGSHPSDNITRPFKSRAIADIKIDEEREWSRNTSHEDPHGDQASAELHSEQRRIPHRESRFSMNSNYQDFHTSESALFDVNLVVKANSRPQHVPYVSLTSKINGPSIIGHLLSVEVLNDGFCDNLINDSIWHGRRCKFAKLDEELGEPTISLGGSKLDLQARSNSVGRTSLKHTLQNAAPSKSRKYGLLSKKIRKLSSLTGAREECGDEKKLIVDQGRGPSLACVPLTIAFSRLNEALSSPK